VHVTTQTVDGRRRRRRQAARGDATRRPRRPPPRRTQLSPAALRRQQSGRWRRAVRQGPARSCPAASQKLECRKLVPTSRNQLTCRRILTRQARGSSARQSGYAEKRSGARYLLGEHRTSSKTDALAPGWRQSVKSQQLRHDHGETLLPGATISWNSAPVVPYGKGSINGTRGDAKCPTTKSRPSISIARSVTARWSCRRSTRSPGPCGPWVSARAVLLHKLRDDAQRVERDRGRGTEHRHGLSATTGRSHAAAVDLNWTPIRSSRRHLAMQRRL
jgi:hypothetical protein